MEQHLVVRYLLLKTTASINKRPIPFRLHQIKSMLQQRTFRALNYQSHQFSTEISNYLKRNVMRKTHSGQNFLSLTI